MGAWYIVDGAVLERLPCSNIFCARPKLRATNANLPLVKAAVHRLKVFRWGRAPESILPCSRKSTYPFPTLPTAQPCAQPSAWPSLPPAHTPTQSIKRLNATCDWRAQAKPESVVCAACAKNSRSHYMHVVGHDLLGRPIIYSCLALAENKVYEDNRDHMIQTFETAIKCMPPGVEQWVWVCDFEGFGMSDALNVKIAKAFLDISAAHYPERLGQFVLLDAPPLFSMLWKAIQSFVDPKTHKKIRFVPYDANSKKAAEPGGGQFARLLAESFDETTQAWLAREVAENRDKRVAKTKHYHVGNIHRAASAGQLQGLCKQLSSNVVEVRQNIANSREGTSGHGPERYSHSRSEDGTASGHDARGTCTLLQMYQDQPAILEPQALVMRGKQSV
eukprot:359517-Chlamydomonas_euryale.AAC.15